MKNLLIVMLILTGLSVQSSLTGQPEIKPPANIRLADLHWCDVCIYPDQVTKTYYMVGPGRRGVRLYTSRDLLNWLDGLI